MKVTKILPFLYKWFTSDYVSQKVCHSRELRAFCKKAASTCKTIDWLENALDNHKAMIAAYWCMPGDCIVDVGMNQGNYSLFYQNLVGVSGSVIGYEANPFLYGYLENRFKKHGVNNILIKRKAASRVSGEVVPMKVYPDPHNIQCGMSTLESDLMNAQRMPGLTEMVNVETEKLDDLLASPSVPAIKLIKIDVEGHEQAVLDGAQQLIKKHRPLVIFEYGVLPGQIEPKSIAILEGLEYLCYDLKSDQRVHPGFRTLLTDVMAIPKEKSKELAAILSQLYVSSPVIPFFFRKVIGLLKLTAEVSKRKAKKHLFSKA